MRILMAHNRYKEPGGEDECTRVEASMLREFGNEVDLFVRDNRTITSASSLGAAACAIWSRHAYREVRALLHGKKYDVVHVQNFFPIISPAIYYAARAEGVPVVQTLHNYRLLCPSATFYRDGHVCENCMGKVIPWPAVVHSCYRSSRPATAATVAMLSVHRLFGTWNKAVSLYIALTEFAKRKFMEGGIPERKIAIKPNAVHPDPGVGNGKGNFALYVGRLSSEKGIDVLIESWPKAPSRPPLIVVGDGPLLSLVTQAASKWPDIRWVGRKSLEEVHELMGAASFLVVPSRVYEGFPRTIVESFAAGTPVMASAHGAMPHLIEHERTGLLFRPADADDLAAKVAWAHANPEKLAAMRGNARAEYELKYGAERNVRLLLDIYDRARRAA